MELCLISHVNATKKDHYGETTEKNYPKLFQGLGHKKELARMLNSGVISKVDSPTEWCVPMAVMPKANGKVRVRVDLSSTKLIYQKSKTSTAISRHNTGQHN